MIVLWVIWIVSLALVAISIIGYIALLAVSRFNKKAKRLYMRYELDFPFAIMIICIIAWTFTRIIADTGACH